jgi:hypothetical protein
MTSPFAPCLLWDPKRRLRRGAVSLALHKIVRFGMIYL